jgi:hypothetical protein
MVFAPTVVIPSRRAEMAVRDTLNLARTRPVRRSGKKSETVDDLNVLLAAAYSRAGADSALSVRHHLSVVAPLAAAMNRCARHRYAMPQAKSRSPCSPS